MPTTRHKKKVTSTLINKDEERNEVGKGNLDRKIKDETLPKEELIDLSLPENSHQSLTSLDGNEVVTSLSSEESSEADTDDETSHAKLLKRRKKIQHKKQELIRKLKLHETAAHLRMSLSYPKTSPSLKRKSGSLKSPARPARKSLRLQKIEASADAETPESNVQEFIEEPRLPTCEHRVDSNMESPLTGDDEVNEGYGKLSQAFKELKVKVDSKQSSLQKMLDDFKSADCKFRKVVDKRIYSLAVHGRSDVLCVAAASTSGTIGVWNLEENKETINCGSVHNFFTYGRNISTLVFPTAKPNLLYFCSYAGVVRALDLEKLTFQKCLIDDIQLSVSSFDFQNVSNDVIIAGSSSGDVIVSDCRSRSEKAVHSAHNRVIKSVSVHPVEKNYFATASNDCTVKIFDFRKLAKTLKPVSVLHQHAKSIDSAYFSPLTGNMLLTTSLDNRIRIFDVTNTSDVRMTTSISHNNHTGRWLSNFKATWHPFREDLIVVGSMNRPRQVDILGSNLETLLELTNEEQLQSVCSLNVFHPSRHVIIGGNSSGKVYVFGS